VNAIIETAIKKIYLTDVAAVIEEASFSASKPSPRNLIRSRSSDRL
jgi:hypothetical protein